jgi:hypothetical protein
MKKRVPAPQSFPVNDKKKFQQEVDYVKRCLLSEPGARAVQIQTTSLRKFMEQTLSILEFTDTLEIEELEPSMMFDFMNILRKRLKSAERELPVFLTALSQLDFASRKAA